MQMDPAATTKQNSNRIIKLGIPDTVLSPIVTQVT